MTKLSLFVCALFVVGCKDKAPAKQASKESPVPKPTLTVSTDNLATIGSDAPKVMLDTMGGVVQIAADGSLSDTRAANRREDGTVEFHSGKTMEHPPSGAAIASLAGSLGLPEVAKRRPSAFAASAAGSDASANPTDVQFARLGHPEPAAGSPAQAPRVTSAFAIAHPFDVSAGVLVSADAKAPATALVDALGVTGGFIAIKHGTTLGALPFAFDRQEPPFAAPTQPWTELRLGPTIELATVPGDAVAIASVDKIAEAVTAAKPLAVDVLVAPETKVADLVAALEQLRAAKIEAIGLGRLPAAGSPEATARAAKGPRVLAWDFYMQGMEKTDLSAFKKPLDAAVEPIRVCYEKALAKAKDAGGVAKLEMIVETSGKVADLQATGVPNPLAACIGDAMKAATFPPVATPSKVTAQLAFVPR